MNEKRCFAGGVVGAALLFGGLLGCGGEGNSLPSGCPNLKLYKDRENLTEDQLNAYKRAEDRGCITRMGKASTEQSSSSLESADEPDAGE